MKIALAHRRLDLRGGTERVFYRTAEGLRDRGHEIHLFCGKFSIPPPPGTWGHRVPCLFRPRTARLLTFSLLTPWIIAQHRCDVVVSFDRLARQDLFRSGGGSHRAFLQKMSQSSGLWRRLWYRISPYHRCLLAIEKRQFSPRGCRKIVTVYQQGKREIIEAYGVPEEKVVVIYNGVDHERFHPRRRLENGRKIREGLGIPLDASVVLFVGTGFRRKGLDRLLHLWESRFLKDVYLLVVGNDSRLAYYREKWRHREIFFVGPQAVVEDYYAAADLLALPSIQEAFGNVVLEALASGLPVVTVPEVGAAEEIQGDLREGLLTDPDDPEELGGRILALLDRDRWPQLSRAARSTSERFSWDRYFLALQLQLDEVAGGC